jgi:hypothetical protein
MNVVTRNIESDQVLELHLLFNIKKNGFNMRKRNKRCLSQQKEVKRCFSSTQKHLKSNLVLTVNSIYLTSSSNIPLLVEVSKSTKAFSFSHVMDLIGVILFSLLFILILSFKTIQTLVRQVLLDIPSFPTLPVVGHFQKFFGLSPERKTC